MMFNFITEGILSLTPRYCFTHRTFSIRSSCPSELTRPLTIEDSIQILIELEKHLDSELSHLITSIQSLASRQKTTPKSSSETTNGSAKRIQSRQQMKNHVCSIRNDSGHVSLI